MGNAGRVLMIPKGDYNAATTYEMLDCVYYNGRSYVCKQTSTGNVPTNTTYWQVMTPDSSAEIQALTNYVLDTGVKNLLPFPYLYNSYTQNGITYTVNSDGSITANGTATQAVDFVFFQGTVLKEFKGAKLNGNPLSDALAIIKIEERGGSWTNYGTATDGNDATIAQIPDGTTVWVFLRIFKDAVINNVTFYPMIRPASITDPTYQPYAKTNAQLTADVAVSKYDDGWLHLRKQGHLVNLVFDTAEFASDGKTFTKTIPAEFRPEHEFFYLAGVCYNGSSYVDAKLVVKNDGTIVLGDNFSNAIQGLLPTYFSGRNSLYYGV